MNRLLDQAELRRLELLQRGASNPAASVWVSANAGSGKTHVLTMRVLRLLLEGVPPQSILCLTYTKAAAAEMRKRVAGRLARWALADDAALGAELADLEGTFPSDAVLQRARTLFAHALDAPGGLSIVTIHAFCESVLHRFPLEAGVPFDFAVIEDAEKAGMILAAKEAVLSEGLGGDRDVSGPVACLFSQMSDHALSEAIDAALNDGRKLRPVLRDCAGAKTRLREFLGDRGRALAELHAEAVRGCTIRSEHVAAVLTCCPPAEGKARFEEKLARFDWGRCEAPALFELFLTKDGEVPKAFPKKDIANVDPALAERLANEARRLSDLRRACHGTALIERSEALLDVLDAIHRRFEEAKRARGLLDFDDLISRIALLFGNEHQGAWVRYRLDAGITHILVDESQDTNPEQWEVVRAIAAEFFAGEGAVARRRTLFAVGDEKQSIFSFQGADPSLFDKESLEWSQRVRAAGHTFQAVPLQTSLRSLPQLLNAVDLVFKRSDLHQAVMPSAARADEAALAQRRVRHVSARAEKGGLVTLWPVIADERSEADDDAWPLEPSEPSRLAVRRVAEGIAAQISNWIASGRRLGGRTRAVEPHDVLILVQRRGPLFFEIMRALSKAGLPTPGVDRLKVTRHIGVSDLLALGDVLLNPADDLQLAALLRSPLFDFTEETLFALCHERPGTLYAALEHSAAKGARAAYEQLQAWRNRLDFDRPFNFFASVLQTHEGLKRFHARFGAEIDDVFAEFLDLAIAHEQTSQPSLQGFLAALRRREVEIKREFGDAGGGVRVMTVHGAKGLEAPIVILADAASPPSSKSSPVRLVVEAPGPLFIHAGAKKDHVEKTLALREEADLHRRREYWRLLYVGMTRAEDELYLTGALGKTGKVEGSWYDAVRDALSLQCDAQTGEDGETLVYPKGGRSAEAGTAVARSSAREAPLVLEPLPKRLERITLRPSSAGGAKERLTVLETGAEVLRDADTARREGLALHALLQHLLAIADEDRLVVAHKALQALWPEQPGRHAAIAEKAIRLLKRDDLAFLFGPDSRAEVPFILHARRGETPVQLAGRIDRLVANEREAIVLDYKSDAAAPERVDQVPEAYLRQIGLYARVAGQLFPNCAIRSAILWTGPESLMFVSDDLLGAATEAFTME